MQFGAHVSSKGGLVAALDRAVALGCEAMQVFLQSPRMWKTPELSADDCAAFRAARDSSSIAYVTAHASYLINVASPDPELRAKSTAALAWTCTTADRLGFDSVIVHPGSTRGDALADRIESFADACRHALADTATVQLLLENSAGAGATIGRSADELVQLATAIDHDRVGICLDTCHFFVSGIDIRSADVLNQQLDVLAAGLGDESLKALHLNDAATELGSNRDRHANLGEGTIGNALSVFLGLARVQHLPVILEVPGDGDGPRASDVARARALHAAGISG